MFSSTRGEIAIAAFAKDWWIFNCY